MKRYKTRQYRGYIRGSEGLGVMKGRVNSGTSMGWMGRVALRSNSPSHVAVLVGLAACRGTILSRLLLLLLMFGRLVTGTTRGGAR